MLTTSVKIDSFSKLKVPPESTEVAGRLMLSSQQNWIWCAGPQSLLSSPFRLRSRQLGGSDPG